MIKINKAELDLKLAVIARDILYDHLDAHNRSYVKTRKKLTKLFEIIPKDPESDSFKELTSLLEASKVAVDDFRADMKERLEQANKVIMRAEAEKRELIYERITK